MVSRSMQFSRSNLRYIASRSSETGSGERQSPQDENQTEAHSAPPTAGISKSGVALDPETLPSWQQPFVLGRNVRFTRTPTQIRPDRDASTRQNAHPPASDTGSSPVADLQDKVAQAVTAMAADESPIVAVPGPYVIPAHLNLPPRTGSPLRIPPRPPRDKTAVLPDVSELARRAIEQQSPQVSTVAPTPTPAPAVQTEPTYPKMPETAVPMPQTPTASAKPARPLAIIPDHLLWEMLSSGASERAETRPATTTAQPRSFAGDLPDIPSPGTPSRPNETASRPPVHSYTVPATAPRFPRVKPAAPAVQHAAAETESTISAVHLYRQIELRRTTDPSLDVATAEAQPVSRDEIGEAIQTEIAPLERVPATVIPSRPEVASPSPSPASARRSLSPMSFIHTDDYLFPSVDLLQQARFGHTGHMTQEALEQSAGLLESVLEDFGVKGEIIDVRPGPVVTLYEFEPAPGVKSSRVINLADDIARSMSSVSARVAVVPGRNVIGIELPNNERETVYLRELIESRAYVGTEYRLPLCLGKTIGGEPVVAELAKMPHLLVAGTTGSGKSVAINTMILSLIYHLRPEECRLIMVDPKMLELSVYDGIPHLLTPVVTDPKKAVLALKWAVREMEDRYRKMSKLGVRNIDGFNERVAEARASDEKIMLSVPVGFDKGTGEQIFEEQELDLTALPYIVVIVDEMADLMMVAGKEIEGAIQRLAQMARAAGIHLIMATQRPSVDVITGTIKANFPTRISFQVTSKIDSRTILGEQGAENLLGQGDMLHMKGGGRIARVHGPFVADAEVEKVVAHLKTQGQPAYLGSVTEDSDEDMEDEDDSAVFDNTSMGAAGSEDDGDDLFERAVKIVQRDKKCSTSYIQRRLSIGYNRAASLVERMEKEGLVGPANHVGKREILEPRAHHAVEPQAEE